MNYQPSTIERPTEYLYHKALQNREQKRYLDAVELLRSAVERAPDKAEYRLELASLYADIGCMRQSDELVLEALSNDENRQQCLYQLSLNRMAEHDLPRALHAISLFRLKDPENENAAALSSHIRWHMWMERTWARDMGRQQNMLDRACEALRDGDPESARDRAEEVIGQSPDWNQAKAVAAAAHMQLGDDERAYALAVEAAAGPEVTPRDLTLSAQVMLGLGREAEAKSMLDQAMQMVTDDADIWMTIRTLAAAKLHSDIDALTRRVVRDRPYDRWFLHARAVSLMRMGDTKQAVRLWERILRMDPNDSIAAYYHEAARDGALDVEALPYAYQLPDDVAREWVKELIFTYAAESETIAEAWREDAALRRRLRWAFQNDVDAVRLFALLMTLKADQREGLRILRERMTAGTLSLASRTGLVNLANQLCDMRAGLDVEYATPEEWALSDEELDLRMFSIGERQAMRYTAQVIDEEYGIRTFPSIVMLYTAYRARVDRSADPLVHTEALCAALARLHLQRIHMEVSDRSIADAFGCSLRQLKYYANRILHAIQGVEDIHEDL